MRLSSTLLLLGLAACSAAPLAPDRTGEVLPFPELARKFTDRTPNYVPEGALDCVVMLYDARSHGLGSATVIARDRLLTAAHVIDDLPRRDGKLRISVDGRTEVLRVLAEGDPDEPHGDWAVLEAAEPKWTQVATIHEPARSVAWSPAPDTTVLLVGYAAGFFPQGRVDVDAPTPSVVVKIRDLLEQTGRRTDAWFASGEHLHLGGMSGGAAMVWNAREQRPELIGTFPGYIATEKVVTTNTSLLGITVGTRIEREPGVAYMIHRLPTMVRRR